MNFWVTVSHSVKSSSYLSYLKDIDHALDRLELVANRFMNNSKSLSSDLARIKELEHFLEVEREQKLGIANACRSIASRLEKIEDRVHFILDENDKKKDRGFDKKHNLTEMMNNLDKSLSDIARRNE